VFPLDCTEHILPLFDSTAPPWRNGAQSHCCLAKAVLLSGEDNGYLGSQAIARMNAKCCALNRLPLDETKERWVRYIGPSRFSPGSLETNVVFRQNALEYLRRHER
jgi:hypothetical protein